jgi:hypothetical protein
MEAFHHVQQPKNVWSHQQGSLTLYIASWMERWAS